MRSRIIGVIVFALTFGIIAACSVPTETAGAAKAGRTSASYALRQGETVTLAPGTTLTLERINDSRCKKGAVCVWAGYISYTFALAGPQGKRNIVLAENMPNAAPMVTQNGLTFALEKLEPPEPPAVDAAVPDYRVSLRVTIAPPAAT